MKFIENIKIFYTLVICTQFNTSLRERVMQHYEQYGSATLTSKVFNISRSIIYDWKKLKTTTGSVKAKEGYQKGYGHKIQDLEDFKKCIGQNTDLTLEIAAQRVLRESSEAIW